MTSTISRAAFLAFFVATAAVAQHEGHTSPPTPTPTPASPDRGAGPGAMEGMEGMEGMDHAAPTDTAPSLFSSDMTAMTGMRPADAHGQMGPAGSGWHVMDLGIARIVFNRQGGASGGGGSAVESSNWNMVHAQREAWGGRLTLMMMNSLEPATFAARGSRELFQTGEAYRGEPLVDRQHPHDFFMNLSATWRRSLGPESGLWIQAAPVGEPALGPVAFMHRASAGDNPTAPLGHHWEDSTHIAFHVVTVGGGWKGIALDASVFRGEEPDEHRWNIEGGRIDSASVRARFFFGEGWSGQISHGFLKTPEPLEAGNTHRTTASVSYGADGEGPFAATLVWGRNDERSGSSEAWLAEAAWQITVRDQIYGRVEQVDKDAALLSSKRLASTQEEVAPGGGLARVRALTVGLMRDADVIPGWKTGVGADATVYGFPRSLRDAYGRFPVSVHAFVRIRWGTPHGGGHGHAGHEHAPGAEPTP